MAALSHLPHELLLQIVSYLHPYSQFSLALVCRSLHGLLELSLRIHKSYYAEYRNITISDEDGRETYSHTSLFGRILKHPELVHYVEKLNFTAEADSDAPLFDLAAGQSSAAEAVLWKASTAKNIFLRSGAVFDGLLDYEDEAVGEEVLGWWAPRLAFDPDELESLSRALEKGDSGLFLAHLLCLCDDLTDLAYCPYGQSLWVALIL